MKPLIDKPHTSVYQIDRSKYRRLLNQAFEEGKELQRLEDIIFRVRQLASKKRTKVKALQDEAENLERTRLLHLSSKEDKKPSKKKDFSEEELKKIFSEEELKTLDFSF